MSPTQKTQTVRADVYFSTLEKAETTTQMTYGESETPGDWLRPPVPLVNLEEMVVHSSILPQCVSGYKRNIAGYGIGIRYREDTEEETPEMKAEWTKLEELLELMNGDCDLKEVFENIIEARETFGIAYAEVIRNIDGLPSQLEFIRDTATIEKTKPLPDVQSVVYWHKGTAVTRKKKFRKYRQSVGGKTVYFKEFGDTRVMDNRTGEYQKNHKGLKAEFVANEILEFSVGTQPYGRVRWLGQVLGIDGSRRAESLNNNYFISGRHTPLLIAIKGGTLSEESRGNLAKYINGVKGEAGQHAFLVLETENNDGGPQYEEQKKPDIELKDMAGVLQKDELFQAYLENTRRKVQSSFQLPDLYVGYTTDFNRATAQTAMDITEKQVFQPERQSLAWKINHQLLNAYQFQFVEVYFKSPDITNPEDMRALMDIYERAGGIPPNKAKEWAYQALGEKAENYEGDWGEYPLALKAQSAQPQIDAAIRKAESEDDLEVVPVLKEIRRLLMEAQENG